MAKQQGIVGFYDILGYQSFLEANAASDAVEQILNTFQAIPAEVKNQLDASMYNAAPIVEITSSIETLLFSDTILVTLPYKANDFEHQLTAWVIFTIYSAYLQRHLFHYGLPIRGAIAFGAFVTKKACFAGEPIIEAYKTGHTVDAAAIVYAPTAETEMARLKTVGNAANEAGFPFVAFYRVPLHNLGSAQLRTVNFAAVANPTVGSLSGDERKLVSESFWKHGKQIPPNAYGKITNTELLLRFLKTVAPWGT